MTAAHCVNPTLALSLVDKAKPHTLFSVGPLDVNQFMVMSLLACVLVLLVMRHVARRVRTGTGGDSVEAHMTRGRLAQLVETILLFLRDTMARPHLGKLTDKYIPYIWSVFFIILFANLLGLMPLGQVVALGAKLAGAENHYEYWQFWGGPAMSNISLTAAMATISFVMIVVVGLRENGVEFLKHFAPVPFKPWPMIPLAAFLVLLEIMGLVIKSCVLALRLFGNILAGFLVVAAMVKMITDFGSLPVGVMVTLGTVAVMFLELFVAFLQTFIFTFLTVLFIAQGAVHHGDDHHDHHDHHEAHPQPAHGH